METVGFPPDPFLILPIDSIESLPQCPCASLLTTLTFTCSLLQRPAFRLQEPLWQHANRTGTTWKITLPHPQLQCIVGARVCLQSGQSLRCSVHSRVPYTMRQKLGLSLQSSLCLASSPSLCPSLLYCFLLGARPHDGRELWSVHYSSEILLTRGILLHQ